MGRTFTNLHIRKTESKGSDTYCGGSRSPLWEISLRSVGPAGAAMVLADPHPCRRCLKSFEARTSNSTTTGASDKVAKTTKKSTKTANKAAKTSTGTKTVKPAKTTKPAETAKTGKAVKPATKPVAKSSKVAPKRAAAVKSEEPKAAPTPTPAKAVKAATKPPTVKPAKPVKQSKVDDEFDAFFTEPELDESEDSNGTDVEFTE